MKTKFKLLMLLGFGAVLFGGAKVVTNVYADEQVSSETEEVVSSKTSETSSISSIEAPTSEEISQTEEEIKNKIENVLSEYFNWDYVQAIINWAIDAGLLSVIAVVVAKTRKYKHLTLEQVANMVKDEMKKTLEDNFKKMSEEQIQSLNNSIDKCCKDMELMKQCLSLAQDKSVEGKIALQKLIASTSTDTSTIETAEKVEEKIVEEAKRTDEVKQAVDGDYKEIF